MTSTPAAPDPLRLLAIAPLRLPLRIKPAIPAGDPAMRGLARLRSDPSFSIEPRFGAPEQTQYSDIGRDEEGLAIATWAAPDGLALLHVFAGGIGVLELQLELTASPDGGFDAAAVAEHAQVGTRAWLQRSCSSLTNALDRLRTHCDQAAIEPDTMDADLSEPMWIARALLLDAEQAAGDPWLDRLEAWLGHTQHPEHAGQIHRGERDCSMTWLNYVLVDSDGMGLDPRIQAMVLAQYVYAMQEQCNRELRTTLADAMLGRDLRHAQRRLGASVAACRLHQVAYHDCLKLLTRTKRRVLGEILDAWEFRYLVENAERMIDLCRGRIEDIDRSRRERGRTLTDLLLGSLSFFVVFELAMYLVEISREMMSRPTLEYTDDRPSFVLSWIASVDVDVMFGIGFGITLLLAVVYRFLKYRSIA